MKKILSAIVLILLLILIASLIKETGKTAHETTIKIGALLPITGKLGNLGEDIRNSLELTRKQILEDTGIDFEIIYEDMAGDPKLALSGAQKLVTTDNVDYIITGPGSSANLAVAPFMEENKVVFISISATPNLNTAGEYIFKVLPDINEEVTLTAAKLSEENLKRVAFIYDSSADSNIIGRDVFKDELSKNGGSVVFSEGYDTKITNDFKDILTKAKGANPDSIYFLGTDKALAIAVPQARNIGITQPLFGWSPTESEDFIKTAGASAEGFTLTTFKFSCEGTSDMKAFCNAYQEEFGGRTPMHYAAHVHDVLIIMKDIVLKNKNPESLKEEIKNGLTSNSYTGITGNMIFDADGNVRNKDLIFKTVKDGKFVELR